MPAITIADLDNAKVDVDHISDVANSQDETAVDRFGHTKKTIQGAINTMTALNPRGAWLTGTAYAVRDLVNEAGVVYIVTQAHTSGVFATDLAAGKVAVYQGVVSTDLASLSDPTKGAAMVGFKPNEVGGVGRPLNEVLLDVVSVKSFGAVGDGVTDDTAAINAAYAITEYPYFPEGEYATSITATRRYFGGGEPVTLAGVAAMNFINASRKRVYLVVINGQSNAQGANSGGPNPANPLVKVWDGVTANWGSSDYTQNPFARSTPNGNASNNNIGLAFAHRLADEYGARVYVVYDAVGGTSIDEWVNSGTASTRYAAIKTKVEAALASTDLVAANKTKVDHFIWAQGEEDALTKDFAAYRTSFTTLITQLRNESWIDDPTPIFVLGMSGLHTRYQVWQAQLDYCENVDKNCIYVNSMGLKTQFDVSGSGDFTHWLGQSLWDFGYYRVWYALSDRGMTHRQIVAPFYARGVGPWRGEADAIAMFKSLVSLESATSNFPINGPAASGSISWGSACSADGNYTFAGGFQTTTDNVCNYSMGWGNQIAFNANGDFSGAFGFQQNIQANYAFACGRGHTILDEGQAALGMFSRYTTAQANQVKGQMGVGTSSGARKNSWTSRADGLFEIDVSSGNDPAQNQEITFNYVGNTQLRVKMRGTDGVVRSVILTLA